MKLCILATGVFLSAQQPLQVLDGFLDVDHQLGIALDVDGEWMIAGISDGAREHDRTARLPVALAYRRLPDGWEPHSLLEADWVPQTRLWSVALDGATAVIGLTGTSGRPGLAWVFELQDEVWLNVQTLSPDVPTSGSMGSLDSFGQSVAIEGNVIVVGSVGFAFVFERKGGSWEEAAILEDLTSYGFGEAVSISMGDVLVAAPGYFGARQPGSVSVYRRAESTWHRAQVLRVHPGWEDGVMDGERDDFGESLATSGDRLLVGSREGPDEGGPGCRAYLYRRVGDCWEAEATLAVEFRGWGVVVALDGNLAAVGASTRADSWSVQAFEQADRWRATKSLDDLRVSDYQTAVALSGRELFLAVPGRSKSNARVGQILVFEASGE